MCKSGLTLTLHSSIWFMNFSWLKKITFRLICFTIIKYNIVGHQCKEPKIAVQRHMLPNPDLGCTSPSPNDCWKWLLPSPQPSKNGSWPPWWSEGQQATSQWLCLYRWSTVTGLVWSKIFTFFLVMHGTAEPMNVSHLSFCRCGQLRTTRRKTYLCPHTSLLHQFCPR